MIQRSYKSAGDVQAAVQLVNRSQGIQKSLEAAAKQADLACEAVHTRALPSSPLTMFLPVIAFCGWVC
jgi:geranylgeranyl pyrophosphate synthase